jgi:hypothetical protein
MPENIVKKSLHGLFFGRQTLQYTGLLPVHIVKEFLHNAYAFLPLLSEQLLASLRAMNEGAMTSWNRVQIHVAHVQFQRETSDFLCSFLLIYKFHYHITHHYRHYLNTRPKIPLLMFGLICFYCAV